MKRIYSCGAVFLATAVLLTVGLTGSASAGSLASAPFYASGTDHVSCSGINVSTTVRGFLTVAIIDDGGLVALNGCDNVGPGVTCSASVEAPKGGFCTLIFWLHEGICG